MKNRKLWYKFYYYSNIIIDNLFWGCFFLLFIYRFLVNEHIPSLLSYLFFLLFGMYLGYKLCRKAYDYLKANQ